MTENTYNLSQTVDLLDGFSKEQIIVFNQWAATGLDRYHKDSKATFKFLVDGEEKTLTLEWDSNFSKDAMVERRKIAEEGGVSLAMFVMAVLLDYRWACQTEIGEGVDYRFQKARPSIENFLANSHHIEVSGLLEESKSNTFKDRVKIKLGQIRKGNKQGQECSVVITLFSDPKTIKEAHTWS